MTYTRDLIRTIGRNAGKVPKHVMANSLGISVSFLERIAGEHGYDLRLIETPPFDPFSTGSAHNPAAQRSDRHSESVTTTLMPRDLVLIDQLAARYGIARARVISRIIERARDRGIIDELARLPALMPTSGEGK